ncbi:MAG: phenylacetate--CoA ligase family protein [Promethearchaeota archaeon]
MGRTGIDNYMKDHEFAPKWNYVATDKLDSDMRGQVSAYESRLSQLRDDPGLWREELEHHVGETLRRAVEHTIFFQLASKSRNLVPDLDHLAEFPTTDRSMLVKEPWAFVPDDADYSDMVMYYSTGTTGHPMGVPKHPVSVGLYGVFIKECLDRWGVRCSFEPDRVGAVLVGFQEETVTFSTRLGALEDSGFAKINLKSTEWRDPADPCRYLSDLEPEILTGDPLSFTHLAHLYQKNGMEPVRPKAMLPTAVALSPKVRTYLEDTFGCPVIDWYSLTETGPLGYACRDGGGYHLLPPDVHLEVLDEGGRPVGDGEVGEITVTGGRNPYLPLVRYRTGDWGRISRHKCGCGDPMPRIVDLEGRRPVIFQKSSGDVVNNADVAAVIRKFPILEYEFTQRRDLSCELRYAAIPGKGWTGSTEDVEEAIYELFGRGIEVKVVEDAGLLSRPKSKKLRPFRSYIPMLYD